MEGEDSNSENPAAQPLSRTDAHSSCLTCFSASEKLRPGETDRDGGKGRARNSSLDTRGERGQRAQVS